MLKNPLYKQIKIIYEDKDFLVLFKPAGLKVHSSHQGEKQPTLVNWLTKKLPPIKKVGDDPQRPGIIHRLDKATQGLLIVAKNQETFLLLKKAFKERKVEKIYYAWVWGKPKERQATLKNYLIRHKKYPLKMQMVPQKTSRARLAVLEYRVIKSIDKQSLLKISLKTGRTHQIRVQLKNLGCPIINDYLYGGRRQKFIGDKKLKLIAQSLSFSLKGKKYLFEIEDNKFKQGL